MLGWTTWLEERRLLLGKLRISFLAKFFFLKWLALYKLLIKCLDNQIISFNHTRQVVPDGLQVASCSHLGLRPTDTNCRCTCSICTACFVVPRTRRRIGDRAFSVAAPRARNTLPTELKLLLSTTTFRQLKTFLFQSAHGHWEDWRLFYDARSVYRGRNTNDSQLQIASKQKRPLDHLLVIFWAIFLPAWAQSDFQQT